jgi:hypothetical protein
MHWICWVLAFSLIQTAISGTCQYQCGFLISCPEDCECRPGDLTHLDGNGCPADMGCHRCSCSCPNESAIPFWAWFVIVPGLILVLVIAIVAFCCVLKRTIGNILS